MKADPLWEAVNAAINDIKLGGPLITVATRNLPVSDGDDRYMLIVSVVRERLAARGK